MLSTIRRAYLNELLSLIEVLCQSPDKLSEDDLRNADDTLADLIVVGFKLNWLKSKLNEVTEKKKMEQGTGARLKTMEEQLQKLKLMFLNLETQLQTEKVEALAARAPLSFSDMSYNQSTSDRSDIQYRRTRRSTGYHQQQQQPHRSSPAGYGRGAGTGAVTDSSTNVDPCSSSKRSLEKPNNAQGWHQPRVNHSVPDNHNGPNVQSRSQVAGASGGAIPKAPTSQSTTLNTAKAPGDPFSLGPDLMKVTVWGPKQDLLNKAADNQLKKEGNSPSSEKTDVQVQHISLPSHMQKSPVTNIRIPSLQTPDQDPQVPHPMHFGGPNMHMQPPNVAPASFQMTLSTGNTLQIQQQVFFQDLPPSHPMHQAQGHGFATPMGAQIHPQLGQQKGPFSSPHTPVQVLHKAERKYQVGAVVEQAKQWKFKGILNKLTPQNFEKLLEQVKSVNIDNAVTLIGVVSQIFDKALMEPTFCEMYADLCFHLSGALPDFKWNGEKISFKRLFLNKCQKEFERGERGEREEEEASRVGRVGEEGQTEQEREEKRLNVRRRMLCNIRLIGELYKKKMLTERIMHACIQKLLGYDQEDPHEENIEALCKLMCTIGVMIDHDKAKVPMDAYFERMKMLSCKQELSSWARFMLVNVIDLRKNKWQESRHPDIAVRFRAKNQLLRNSCMNSLLSLIETLCQPLEDLSNEDLIGAEIALTYVKDSGFSVDWLEKKLDQVKEMKEKEVSGLAILQVTEEKLLKLKQKCAELEALAEEQKAESSATITPLSFYDVMTSATTLFPSRSPTVIESVKLIFERHPDIAEEFYAKNQHLRNACMTFLLSLVETLCQSLEKLSNEDLVEADIALTYLKDAGFKVDWLEKKLDQLKDKKEKEKSCLARLQEIEEHLQKLKQQCSELDALAEDEKTDLSATRTALSFDDIVI
ncbi:hypothetical protein HID58_071450 [Brassica napus]|uniref:MIF4G domain-containing protein n=1 Tax=Brassica napus TaxID=3708 RepID=A0ABQ7Z1Q3_BRANA|nr:hypothetical protein HID58_071450 [Brassica napus]